MKFLPEDVKKILLIRTDRIGDVVLTTPAMQTVREQFPSAHITVLLTPVTRSLVEGLPFVDEVFVDDRRGAHAGPGGFARLVADVRKRRFDLALNYHTKRRTNFLCFLSGIPRRVGYNSGKWGHLMNIRVPDSRHLGQKHEVEYCLDFLRFLDVPAATRDPEIAMSPASLRWARELADEQRSAYPGHALVCVHAGSSCPTKRWPIPNFVQTVRHVYARRKCVVFVIGGPEEQADARSFCSGLPPEIPCHDLTGRTSLSQTAALLKECGLLISSDSGPVHVADAAGTAVVSIFTRNQPGINPERWRPWGAQSRCVAPEPGEGVDVSRGGRQDAALLYHIAPQKVMSVIDAVYELC
ncbi:MAG: glycosyltransferase family 9 protein [Candidatus Omnitrophota bacterium]